MTDRIPVEVLENGAIRYAEYDSGGNFVQYRYLLNADGAITEGTPLNKSNLLSNATASALRLTQSDPTVDDALSRISGAAVSWQLLKTYNAAGSYTYTFPSGYSKFGVTLMGGGSSGGSHADFADGGNGGFVRHFVIDGDQSSANIVVGAGGAMGTSVSNGGTTSFIVGDNSYSAPGGYNTSGNGINGQFGGGIGGRGTSLSESESDIIGGAVAGSIPMFTPNSNVGGATLNHARSQISGISSPFDPTLTFSAGGGYGAYPNYNYLPTLGATSSFGKGGDGGAQNAAGMNATGNGNGGGGYGKPGKSGTVGAGSPGLVLIYGGVIG